MSQQFHAFLEVKVEKENPIGHESAAIIKMYGCRNCLVDSIAKALLADEGFKDLVNRSVRMANEIKARKQN